MTKEELIGLMQIESLREQIADWMVINSDTNKLRDEILAKQKTDRIAELEATIPILQSELTELKATDISE